MADQNVRKVPPMTVTLITTDVVAPTGNGDAFGNSGLEEVTVGFGSSIFVAEDVNVAANGNLLDINDIGGFEFHMNGDAYAESSAFRMVTPTSGASFNFIQYELSFGETADITSGQSLGFIGIFSTTPDIIAGTTRLRFQNDGVQSALLADGYTIQNIDDVNIINNGTMTASGSLFVFSVVEDADLINTGSLINGRADAIRPTVDYRNNTDNAYFFNSGTVTGPIQALRSDVTGTEEIINEGAISGDVLLSNTVGGTMTNTGSITGNVDTRGGNDTILNTGNIVGEVDTGDNNDSLTNIGLITGNVDLGGGDDTVSGAGAFDGSIDLGTGNDTFDGRGNTFYGTVIGGSGSDTYLVDNTSLSILESTLSTGGTDTVISSVSFTIGLGIENLALFGSEDINGAGNFVANVIIGNDGANLIQGRGDDDTITGGGGDDTLGGGAGNDSIEAGDSNDFANGGAGNDTVLGDEGNDTLRGGSGNDRILGGEDNDNIAGGLGNDTLLGEDGDDMMFGQGGADAFNGGEGEDYIHGGAGGDTLSGANGDDTLVGGGGSDQLTGGNGADVFEFQSFAQSRATGGQFDIITDFQIGSDLIDLTALVEGTINFGGTGAASANGEAELLLRTPGGGPNTVVFVDVNGDGTQDFRINVTGVTGLSETDFLL